MERRSLAISGEDKATGGWDEAAAMTSSRKLWPVSSPVDAGRVMGDGIAGSVTGAGRWPHG